MKVIISADKKYAICPYCGGGFSTLYVSDYFSCPKCQCELCGDNFKSTDSTSINYRTIKDVHGQGGMKVHVYDGIWTSCPNCSCEISVQGLGNNFTCPQCQCELYKEGSAQTEYHSNSCDNNYGGSASNYRTEKKDTSKVSRLDAGTTAQILSGASESEQIYRYNQGKTGHGWAAEDINNAYDRMAGKDAKLVGTDNKANGADRLVNGREIQTKYYKSVSSAVDDAFKHGNYRYLNKNGNPMIFEVPKDQYDKAIKLFQDKIREGKVVRQDGTVIRDPRQAYRIVKKGSVTYDEAVNIAKGGTIDSLWYDVKTSAVNCAAVGGISAIITFVDVKRNGATTKEAAKEAGKSGIKSTAKAVAIHATSEQLKRKISEKAVNDSIKTVVKGGLSSAAKTNIVTGVVSTVAVTVPDIVKSCKKQQSWKTTAANGAENAACVAGGMLGAAKLGAALGSPGGIPGMAVGFVGGVVGSLIASTGVKLMKKKRKKK